MARYRSGQITIDAWEVIDQIDDEELLEELRSRKLTPAEPGETVDLDIVREAHEALQRGHVADARCTLERLLYPKWKAKADCETDYKKFFAS